MAVVRRDSKGNEFELQFIVCPTCGDVPQELIGLRGGRTHRYGLGIETPIVRCTQCTLLFPNPFPIPVAPQVLYGDPESYFSRHNVEAKVASYRGLVEEVRRHAGIEAPSILDVGSGKGEFVRAAKLQGLSDVVGLELSDAMIRVARERLDVSLTRATVEAYAARSRQRFDAIILNAILEHVYDPDSFMAAVASLSRPGTILYIDVPNEPNLLTTVGNAAHWLLGRKDVFNLMPTWPPFHVFGFNPRALRTLLDKHSFELESVRIRSNPYVPSSRALADRAKSWVGSQILRVANEIGMAGNLFAWARHR